jgi:hypothetical protein
MPFATTIIQGRSGTFLLSDPRPRIKINRGDVDEREDTWHADAFPHTLLFEGAPHPQFPGLILDTADFEEFAPAFPPVPGFDGQAGDYRAACRWLGNAQSTEREGATKLISRGMERSLGPNFDEIPFSYLSWTAEPRAITGTASTDTIHLPGNPFQNGQRVVLVQLTGGTGLTGQSTSSLGTVYYVINRTADGLQLATTLGGSALDFTTDITAGHRTHHRRPHGRLAFHASPHELPPAGSRSYAHLPHQRHPAHRQRPQHLHACGCTRDSEPCSHGRRRPLHLGLPLRLELHGCRARRNDQPLHLDPHGPLPVALHLAAPIPLIQHPASTT